MSRRRESDSRSSPYQGDVLPLNYSGRRLIFFKKGIRFSSRPQEKLIGFGCDQKFFRGCNELAAGASEWAMKIELLSPCGQGGICTPVGVSHLIYSQVHLTTLVPTREV